MDLYNEGLHILEVNTVLFLRITEDSTSSHLSIGDLLKNFDLVFKKILRYIHKG